MMRALSIRSARARERQDLEALQWRASLANPGDRDALLAHPDAIEVPSWQIDEGRVFVAEAQGKILGFAAVLPRGDADAELDALFVEPGRWRQGIGRRLVEHCARTARIMGADALHVTGNPHAEAFYAGCGFELIGTTPTRFGVGLSMCKPL